MMVTGLVHDYLLVMRGAERTFAHIAACFPGARIFTLLYDDKGTEGVFAGRVAGASRLQRLPVRQRGFRKLLPLFPSAIDRMELGDHNTIVSSSSAFGHGVRVRPGTTHICYCHTPFRYAWYERERALAEVPALARPLLDRQLDRIQRWDIHAASRVDHFIANSRLTQQRIADFWGRESTVVHPPVDTHRFVVKEAEDFFLIVGELVPHKLVAEALGAAERAGRRVKVVGTGPSLKTLRRRFHERTEFLGRVQDDHLAELMARATAVVVPSVEEFGITAVEAQAAGRPVVGPDQGGTAETIIGGETGVHFPAGNFDALAEVLRDVDFSAFEVPRLQRSADRFCVDSFRRSMIAHVAQLTGDSDGPHGPQITEPAGAEPRFRRDSGGRISGAPLLR
jgi:glycosyltransferase involved in cell wall biosynthesis